MRTTLALDQDVLALARKSAARLGKPFKEVVNSALRIGLEEISKQSPAKPYKTKPHPLGLKDGFTYDNTSELL